MVREQRTQSEPREGSNRERYEMACASLRGRWTLKKSKSNIAPQREPRRRITLTTEARLIQVDENTFAAVDATAGETQWRRYVNDEWDLTLLARSGAGEDREGSKSLDPISSARVVPLKPFRGVWAFLISLISIFPTILKQVRRSDLIILRVPGLVSSLVGLCAMVARRPYVVDIVGDVGSVMASSTSRFVRSLKSFAIRFIRLIVRRGSAVRYVTFETLQSLYPTDAKSFAISNVQLPTKYFTEERRNISSTDNGVRLLTIGSQELPYKGHDDSIRAVEILASRGVDAHLVIIGDGRFHSTYVDLVDKLRIAHRVTFLGRVSHDEALVQMQKADILVHPSLSEGLPRVIIEAMSQACPVIATRAGGIPELVRDDALVPIRAPHAIADKVQEILSGSVYTDHSRSAIKSAHRFNKEKLDEQFGEWQAYLESLIHGASPNSDYSTLPTDK